jgi:hypothetical protein
LPSDENHWRANNTSCISLTLMGFKASVGMP